MAPLSVINLMMIVTCELILWGNNDPRDFFLILDFIIEIYYKTQVFVT